jgi:hypothetical protein
MGTGSFPGVALTTHPYLAPRLKEEYSYKSAPSLGLRGQFQAEIRINVFFRSKTLNIKHGDLHTHTHTHTHTQTQVQNKHDHTSKNKNQNYHPPPDNEINNEENTAVRSIV